MVMTVGSYARQLRALFPRGAAWRTDKDAKLTLFIAAMAGEFYRIHQRVEALLREMNPRTTVEMLADWEEALGLPDPCVTDAQTEQQRRTAILLKLTTIGAQNKQFYIDLAARLGFEITITEPDTLTWQVNAPETTISYFRVSESGAGDPLRSWGNKVLECAIEHRAPAHTVLQFAYGS